MNHFLPLTNDCKHRDYRTCLKTGKIVVLDKRDADVVKCWNMYGCEFYEPKINGMEG